MSKTLEYMNWIGGFFTEQLQIMALFELSMCTEQAQWNV